MRRSLLGCCEGCKHMTYGPGSNCNNSGSLGCKGCRLHTKPLPMGGRESEPTIPEHGPVMCHHTTCRCLQNATEQELKTHICKYRRSK